MTTVNIYFPYDSMLHIEAGSGNLCCFYVVICWGFSNKNISGADRIVSKNVLSATLNKQIYVYHILSVVVETVG